MRHLRTFLGFGLLVLWTGSSLATPPVNLGTASGFAVLAGSAITNTGSSLVNGDLGLDPLTAVSGFPPGTLNGTQYVADATSLQAQNDLTTAYNDVAGRSPITTIGTELGGSTLTPDVYTAASGTFELTGTLTLDAENDPNAVFIFQMASTLNTASGSTVELTRGAQPCNVFWQVGSSATLGTNSTFSGNILAFTSIAVTTGTVVEGRVLARNGAVTLDTDTISVAACVCFADDEVTLVANDPNFPAEQNVFACAHLSAGFNTQVVVPVLDSDNMPTVTIASGCASCGDFNCEPLSDWVLGDWVFVPSPPTYVADLTAGNGAVGCCVCLHLDFVLPVELATFDVAAEANGIRTTFSTASELNNDQFEILRSGSANGSFTQIASLASQGNSSSGHDYSYLDENVTSGQTYWYYLVDVSLTGDRTEHRELMRSATALDEAMPLDYSLNAYPNPFNPVTTVQFSLKEAGDVRLSVYNVSGQWMRDLTRGHHEAGEYTVKFDAGDLPSGIYFAQLDAGVFSQTTKLALLK